MKDKMKTSMQQMDIFDEEFSEEEIEDDQLNVVYGNYVKSSKVDFNELFEGYDSLYCVTFSSSFELISKLNNKIKEIEIIFGCDKVINNKVADLIAYQNIVEKKVIQTIKKKGNKNILHSIEKGTLKLNVLNKVQSHAKIYLLKNEDGLTRVICGSANLTNKGFGGRQYENIVVFDNDINAYEFYFNEFLKLKKNCSSFNYNSIMKYIDQPSVDYVNPEDLPFYEYVEKEKIVIMDASITQSQEIDEMNEIENIKEVYKQILPENLQKQKNRIVIDKESIIKVKNNFKKFILKKENAANYKSPQLLIDYDSCKLYFNDQLLDQELVVKEKVKGDIEALFLYLDSLSECVGDVERNQKNYYKLFVWCMVSPFISYFRYLGEKYQDTLDPNLPKYAAVYGESNGGKTTFFKLMAKMMTGKKIVFPDNENFTPSRIRGLKSINKGIPLFFDDIAKARMEKFEEIVKSSDDTYKTINEPCILLSTNKDVTSMKDYISKRCFSCYIDVKMNKTKGVKIGKTLLRNLNNATNNFFIEFAYRMFEEIDIIKENICDENYQIDIFASSSRIIKEIINEFIPNCDKEYIRLLTREDYFGDEAIGINAKMLLIELYKYNRENFVIDKKKNKLIYKIPQGDFSANRTLKIITDEMPINVNAKRSGNSLIMELKETEKFTNMKFKKKYF